MVVCTGKTAGQRRAASFGQLTGRAGDCGRGGQRQREGGRRVVAAVTVGSDGVRARWALVGSRIPTRGVNRWF
jgi:hypothetical protein